MMHKLLIGLMATLAINALTPSRAEAQRRGGGTVTTPFGSFNANDMRAAGGNPFVAESMREQKMEMLYEQQLFKQQQQYMLNMAKQQKARQDYLKKHPEVAKAEADAEAAARAKAQPKRKSATAKSSTTKSAAASKTAKAATTSSGTTSTGSN